MESRQSDYISAFQDTLQSTIDILDKCSQLDSSLESILPASDKDVRLRLASSLDAAALSLGKGYLQIMDAQSQANEAAKASDTVHYEAARREDTALEVNGDFDLLAQVFSQPIKIDDRRRTRSSRALNEPKAQECQRFLKKVVGTRVHKSSDKNLSNKVTTELCKLLYSDYIRQKENEDEDMSVGSAVIKPICPLTSEPLQEPVRAPCGHYFSKQSILAAIAANANACKCPSAGCSQYIQANSLIRDPLKDLEVSQWVHDEERKRLEDTQSMTHI